MVDGEAPALLGGIDVKNDGTERGTPEKKNGMRKRKTMASPREQGRLVLLGVDLEGVVGQEVPLFEDLPCIVGQELADLLHLAMLQTLVLDGKQLVLEVLVLLLHK